MNNALVIYSGGLDTTVCLALLRAEGVDDITAVTIDVGQPADDIELAEQRAGQMGVRQVTIDAKQEFADDYCSVAIAFNADYYGYPLSTAIARPLIARKAAEFALAKGPFGQIVHGCTGKGNDQFRIEYGLRANLPGVCVRAPIRERNWTRSAEIEYAEAHGAPIGQSKEKIWSIDENLWGRSIEGGRLEDPSYPPPEEIFAWTSSKKAAPNDPIQLDIAFERGVPKSIGGKEFRLCDLIQELNAVAGSHGVGRIDVMEDRLIGLKVRENYECPAATVLVAAHKALESLVCTPEERRFKALVDQAWAEHVYAGLWGDPFFADLVGFSSGIEKRVAGNVKMELYKGSVTVLGRTSPFALYSEAEASFDDSSFSQSSMTGMVQSHGMSSLLYEKLKSDR